MRTKIFKSDLFNSRKIEQLISTVNNSCITPYERLKVCILVPTFNNGKTLAPLIQDLLVFNAPIFVVNDGSTDNTEKILDLFPKIDVISYSPNRGKGYALCRGFEAAVMRGFDYAISIDSDGQHFSKDIPVFINCLEQNPGSLVIGARNMNQSSVPGKSSFGHHFSNFWFKVETGIRLPDTQSGYRLYPVARLQSLHFITRRFEFEIEVIVRAAWKGIPVISCPSPFTMHHPAKGFHILDHLLILPGSVYSIHF